MGRVGVAFKAFFKSLFDTEIAERVGHALEGEAEKPKLESPKAPEKKPEPVPPKPARSEAVTLLAALQREARFIDFVKEPLDGLTDEQVGAAVRDIHRNLAGVVNRMFGPKPVLTDNEGETIEVPKGFDASRYRLIGQVSGAPPHKGILTHHGWQVATCQLPEWTGTDEAAPVIAPAEVEIK
ncbi:MAG: DUF2760 domain-containing protein [Planctomycetaceae bacterium]|nr:DUF2760 domain-containing protein [Planctomycetaceae bacterium]